MFRRMLGFGMEQKSCDTSRGHDAALLASQIISGGPNGTAEFVQNHAQSRMHKGQALFDWLPKMGDLQCSWILLALSV